ncbi:MAG: patatin-like phospholipase family protein [Blastocatellia bacterium]
MGDRLKRERAAQSEATASRNLGLTFAGGGTCSFYQLGVMNRWREQLLPRLAALSAVSAGACVAALMLSRREAEVAELWKTRSRDVTRNFDWRRLLAGQRPTQHETIYRDLLLNAFSEGGFERIRSQPFPIFILATAFSARMPAMLAGLLGLCAYRVERRLRKRPLDFNFGRKVGLTAAVFDARDCREPAELVDLIIASSATPPFTSVGAFSGRRLLDGGLIDNAPAFLTEGAAGVARNVILLTQPHADISVSRQGRRLIISPAQPLPLKAWDYTHPDLIFDIVAQGERDAERYDADLSDFLFGNDER